jgi:hypothetical protein
MGESREAISFNLPQAPIMKVGEVSRKAKGRCELYERRKTPVVVVHTLTDAA